MSYADEPRRQNSQTGFFTTIGIMLFFFVTGMITLGMWGCPQYEVWQKGKLGEAQLSQAMQNRKIQIQEAEAKMESSKLWAQAEVIRADGVAKANKIIGESLHNNEAYLRYLWIIDVAGSSTNKTVVYVPTETNLPILEAGRFAPTLPAPTVHKGESK